MGNRIVKFDYKRMTTCSILHIDLHIQTLREIGRKERKEKEEEKKEKEKKPLGKIGAFRSRARNRAIRARKSTMEVGRPFLHLQFVFLSHFKVRVLIPFLIPLCNRRRTGSLVELRMYLGRCPRHVR